MSVSDFFAEFHNNAPKIWQATVNGNQIDMNGITDGDANDLALSAVFGADLWAALKALTWNPVQLPDDNGLTNLQTIEVEWDEGAIEPVICRYTGSLQKQSFELDLSQNSALRATTVAAVGETACAGLIAICPLPPPDDDG